MNTETILHRLLDTKPMLLEELPSGPGIYALYDHDQQPRYIGITQDVFDRVFKRHVGGDGNSHKFSSIYNAGRMFHDRKVALSDKVDGKIAKSLRRIFAREYCRAVAVTLPAISSSELLELEGEVIGLAPSEATLWNGARSLPALEPEDLVDELLGKLKWTSTDILALERQSQVWRNLY